MNDAARLADALEDLSRANVAELLNAHRLRLGALVHCVYLSPTQAALVRRASEALNGAVHEWVSEIVAEGACAEGSSRPCRRTWANEEDRHRVMQVVSGACPHWVSAGSVAG